MKSMKSKVIVFAVGVAVAGFASASVLTASALAWSPSLPSGFSVIGHGVDVSSTSTCPEFYEIEAPNGAVASHLCDQGSVDAFVAANSSPSAPQTDPATTTTPTTTTPAVSGSTVGTTTATVAASAPAATIQTSASTTTTAAGSTPNSSSSSPAVARAAGTVSPLSLAAVFFLLNPPTS